MTASAWWRLLLSLLTSVSVAVLVGLWTGHVGFAVAALLAILLLRNLYMLQRVLRWLRSDRADQVPDAGGAWGDVIGLIARLFRGNCCASCVIPPRRYPMAW
jgi:two-component system phosphate regulon sensor histidine kinase PhoR